jgi:alkanesulfonate monooxygenase SsuD/methylene tetrahydromethanopterin reductase-like flavin-dependent oxidoreductase (luciferase family)
VHAYYNSLTKHLQPLAAYPTNPNIALVSLFMCAKTDEEARAKADGATFFQFCLRYYGASTDRKRPAPGTVDMWQEYNRWKRENAEAAEKALSGGLIGSPETLRRKLRKFEQSHIDQVILLNQAGGNTHDDICSSLDLFAREVMPEFHANIPEHEVWKAKVLDDTISLEEIDTQQFTARYGKKAVTV